MMSPIRCGNEGLDGEDSQIVLYLGRLIEIKGIDYLMRAFPTVVRRHDQTVLVIVREGPEERRVKA